MNEKELTHIDLFSGVGGFALAAQWAGFKTIAFCEKEEFCQKVLEKRFGAIIADSEYLRKLQSERGKQNKRRWTSNSPVLIPEIRDFNGTEYRGATLLTGGFPCQPFSDAGPKRGKDDDRYLWPEMLRVINEAKPRWILAENVYGIINMALDTVLTDLESEGYTTGTFIIPACGLNAPHRRYRVWIIANSIDSRVRGWSHGNSGRSKCTLQTERPDSHVADSTSKREMSISQQGQRNGIKSPNKNIANPDPGRIQRHESKGIKEGSTTRSGNEQVNPNTNIKRPQIGEMLKQNIQQERSSTIRDAWKEDWYEVATQFCRVDDGIPNRIHRLKALGNAIVPQIAYEILKNIAHIENSRGI